MNYKIEAKITFFGHKYIVWDENNNIVFLFKPTILYFLFGFFTSSWKIYNAVGDKIGFIKHISYFGTIKKDIYIEALKAVTVKRGWVDTNYQFEGLNWIFPTNKFQKTNAIICADEVVANIVKERNNRRYFYNIDINKKFDSLYVISSCVISDDDIYAKRNRLIWYRF